ncbi:hypothetical protein PPERSA_04845 [Pseudocohnilembus persalinus]|uniref:Cilia- and flagella-associated protein 58 central coiled coil domain-containing protein n=1 Tax=Pseudocohnilembus persalinus TaxID=266149 RepID=A0A0V0QIU9_PSEPJ|nr:hypothetical protein PPERSA_04845 [Pseudocohnilembus persalinus]|eukprot:KRX02223.1 hypothetical protein PPERSA_04845 [Pseudocohnilembus persalinus]
MSQQQAEDQDKMALKLLQELLNDKKITVEQMEELQEKFQHLNQTVSNMFANESQLPNKVKKFAQDLKFKKAEFEQAQIENDNSENRIKKIQAEVKKAESELTQIQRANDQLGKELENEETKLSGLQKSIESEITDRVGSITTDLKNLQQNIKEEKEKIEKTERVIQKKEAALKESQEKISLLNVDNEKLVQKSENLRKEEQNLHSQPSNTQKNINRSKNALKTYEENLKEKKDKLDKKIKEIQLEEQKIAQRKENVKRIQDSITEMDGTQKYLTNRNKIIDGNRKKLEDAYKKLNEDKQMIMNEQETLKNQIKVLKDGKSEAFRNSAIQDMQIESGNSQIEKQILNAKRQYKKIELEVQKLKDRIIEYQISTNKYHKEKQKIQNDIKFYLDQLEKIQDDTKVVTFEKKNVDDKVDKKKLRKDEIDKNLAEHEAQLKNQQKFVEAAMKKEKMLTAMRESMARKASSAMAEVRETREELKIKELLILDLTKKHQETEFKLNSFKALYEEVKSARNKYVNLIQNSSQHLAELKERIKILQNELEILKNESAEKDSTLVQYKHILQQEIHKRDRIKQKLNKRNFLQKQKKQLVDQNINEIEKLNMIIMNIEKEMLQLRKQYEKACESRNYTGIQLIDRNDELCILYEKTNIQENILRNGESEIKKLEDEIRMIKIEINEKKRKIDVARKVINEVPKLADKVIELKSQLEIELQKEKALSEAIENPENTFRWRELQGEDPDAEALDAKIHVIEERLNNKKEQLLEKELILDEITNLSEKLRKQALEGRQSTLELSEKLNNFQSRLKDITRKMMASISELSMFQATSIKLQQERDELDKVVEEAKGRVDQGLPPTIETEIEYLKQQRVNNRYVEERQKRMEREEIEKNMTPFAIKTTAEHRVNSYIPSEDLGIPKPYGKYAPYKFSEVGANIRHYRKPVIKDIEV